MTVEEGPVSISRERGLVKTEEGYKSLFPHPDHLISVNFARPFFVLTNHCLMKIDQDVWLYSLYFTLIMMRDETGVRREHFRSH